MLSIIVTSYRRDINRKKYLKAPPKRFDGKAEIIANTQNQINNSPFASAFNAFCRMYKCVYSLEFLK